MNPSVEWLLREAAVQGHKVEVFDGRLKVSKGMPQDLKDRLLQRCAEVVEALVAARKLPSDTDRVDKLRVFMPALLEPVTLRDGREGCLWGVSTRGVLVALAPYGVVLAVEPDAIQTA